MLVESGVSIIDKCYICHSNQVHSFIDNKGFAHVLCDNCHLMRLHPKHFVSNTLLYTDSYFNGQRCRETNGEIGYAETYANPVSSHRTKQYDHYVSEVKRYVFDKREKPVKVLDFGCSYGTFLSILKERMGDGVEIHGVDVDPEVCAKASERLGNATIYCNNLGIDKLAVPQDYFDVITLLDTIEHLDDPRLYLQRLVKYANNTGFLLLSTPNIESFNARLYHDHWILHTPPLHTYYFGPRSIRILLQQTGWRIIDLYTERTIFHNERHGMETWRGKYARLLFQNNLIDFITNRILRIGSIMTVLARRE
jgi:2-polyprenyl-3-methyl-5-hydroxy-6-metoxy-1,4-benzoquinol methylase